VPGVQRLPHDMPANAAGRSEDVIFIWCLPSPSLGARVSVGWSRRR
jgi:hypothetical protein